MNTAIREARQRSKATHPTSAVGYCLREVRECFGVAARAADAAEAWRDAKRKHHETNARKIPRGVPVFWIGGSAAHGHVAIATGDGKCWSTDILRAGYFDKVPIDAIAGKWGMTLVGWTEDLNGVQVYKEGRGGPEESTGVAISGTALVTAIAAMFIAVVAAAVAVSIGVPESQNPGGLVAQLLGSFAALVAVLGTLFKISQVAKQVAAAAENTEQIMEQTNGNLDRRIRELSYDSVRKALTDHLDENDRPDLS